MDLVVVVLTTMDPGGNSIQPSYNGGVGNITQYGNLVVVVDIQ